MNDQAAGSVVIELKSGPVGGTNLVVEGNQCPHLPHLSIGDGGYILILLDFLLPLKSLEALEMTFFTLEKEMRGKEEGREESMGVRVVIAVKDKVRKREWRTCRIYRRE
ncbi:hypothetical protein DM860_014542 [Cuscuta australis]|uniref:Uncharacterized protein n=1 Tax=Cuscuta australis TaxID=267555 RepID=A0A328DZF2_9ASTE|nr:hypothetical protein DM860_014542 [Cuscuta australis]